MSEQLQKPNPKDQPEQPENPEVINTEPEELDDLQKRVRDYSDRKWNAILTVCGGLVGLLCGALLTVFSAMESIGMYGTIGAVVIAVLLPRFAEKRVKRSIQKGRVAMMIALALWLAVTAAVMFIKGVPVFTK
jgi:hypothetical protein